MMISINYVGESSLEIYNLFVLLMDLLSTRRTSHDDGSFNDNLGIWSARDT